MVRLDPNGMLNLCQIKPKYVKINDILTDRFDSIDESKNRFILQKKQSEESDDTPEESCSEPNKSKNFSSYL